MICGNPHCGHLAIRHSQHGCICGCPISHNGLWALLLHPYRAGPDQINRLGVPLPVKFR